jgi:hypothetical protein
MSAAAKAALARVQDEIEHAYANDHVITEGQGIAPGERVPAVRIDYLEAALRERELTQEQVEFLQKMDDLRARLLKDIREDRQPEWLNPLNIKIVTEDNVTLNDQETALALRAVAALARMQSEWHGAPEAMYQETLALEALAKKLEASL